MIKIGGIYMIRNIENNKVYIGSSCKSNGIKKRWLVHICALNKNKHHNQHLQNAWNKYGKENFEFTIVEKCSDDILIIREQSWINYYNSMNAKYGYNLKEAGSRGKRSKKFRHNEKTKKKMSDSWKLGRTPSYGNLGKKASKNSKLKMRRSRISFFNSLSNEELIEFKKKMAYWKGKKLSEETKRRMSVSQQKRRNKIKEN